MSTSISLSGIDLRLLLAALLLCASGADAQTLSRSYGGCCAYGWAVADIGDLDGDGRRDFIVAANNSGQVYAHSSARSEALWVATLAGSDLGYAIASAGDVDGDGVEDVIAGAPSHNGSGIAQLRSGRDGALLREIAAPDGSLRFGAAVSALGDVDADGSSDVLVGAPGSARAHLWSGASGALIATVGQGGGEFGAGIAGVDDLDGDGVREFIVGAPSSQGGQAFVYSGRTRALLRTLLPEVGGGRYGEFFVAGAGDVDADGLGDLYVGAYAEAGNRGAAYVYSGRDGARLHRILGDVGEGLGPGRGAGDVDGDGSADLIVGGYTWSGAGIAEAGRVRIFSGASGSVLASANGSRVRGQLGFDAVGLLDASGDGRLDFIVASAPANAVDLYAGALDRPPVFVIGDGLGGAWRDIASEGQGLFLESHSGLDVVSGAWFTHSRLPPDAGNGLRWFSFAGRIEGDAAQLPVVLTTGGIFDTPGAVQNRVVGTLSLQFRSCTQADARFVLHENAITGHGDAQAGPLRSGRMALTRITPDVRCGAGASLADKARALQAALDAWAAQPAHHGVSAAVVFADGQRWRGSAGLSWTGEALRPDHLIHVASITKTMTAALVLRAVDAGRLGLDDPIGQHLAPLPNVAPTITIRQLLNHTAGVAAHNDNPRLATDLAAQPQHRWSMQELAGYIGPPLFAPGSTTRYSNGNYLVLGLLAEQLYAQPLAEAYRSQLWQPAGIADAAFMPLVQAAPAAVAEALTARGVLDPLTEPSRVTLGQSAAGAFASAEAIARWGDQLFTGSLLSAPLRAQMLELVAAAGNIPGEAGVGLGIRAYGYFGRTQYGHSGGSGYGNSLLLHDPDTGITVAVLMNQGGSADHFALAPALLEIAGEG